jgi:orotidine-5'-phosphate decarboxylase
VIFRLFLAFLFAPMLPFPDRLVEAQRDAGSVLCVGLDPDLTRLPAPFAALSPADAAERFCRAIVDATAEVACAFKPNLAFFEALGPFGWRALDAVCQHVRRSGRLLICDGKRGDIGNTARRYAASQYDVLGADAATVAPYMGADAIGPFLEHEGRCAFVLGATSNPSAPALQSLLVDGRPLRLHAAEMATKAAEGLPGTLGFVLGATRAELLVEFRRLYPETPLLVPGVGAQGGSIEEALKANAGGPILVNASRSVLYASSGPDFTQAARGAAETLAAQLPTVS